MINQRPGDVLEILFEDQWVYLVVVTKIYLFGGNIVYAFHGDGRRIENFEANRDLPGFNICTDLLLPKKSGDVSRIGKVQDPEAYLVSNLVKSTLEHRPGHVASSWILSKVRSPLNTYRTVRRLSKSQAMAMDAGAYSFDLVVAKALEGYTPDQNPHIRKTRGLLWFVP